MNSVSVIRGTAPQEETNESGQDYGCKTAGSQSLQTPINVNLDERFMSAIMGGFLAGSALRSGGPLRGAVLGALATGLMTRALTGHCAMYGWIGKTSLRSKYKSMNRDHQSHDEVEEAGEESFPASDPPSFTAASREKSGGAPSSANLNSPNAGNRANPSVPSSRENSNGIGSQK